MTANGSGFRNPLTVGRKEGKYSRGTVDFIMTK
jgi:hypothetical protein